MQVLSTRLNPHNMLLIFLSFIVWFWFVTLAVGSEDQRISRLEVGEWAGEASTPLFGQAPVYESKNTVSMGSMRVTRAYVTQEQPRVAEVANTTAMTTTTTP